MIDFSKILVFDAEILTPIITDPKLQEEAAVPYARGFDDFGNMSVSVLCAFPLSLCLELRDADELYKQGQWFWPETLSNAEWYFAQFDHYVGFNSIGFDQPLLRANGVMLDPAKQYDILAEYKKATSKRCKMADLAAANLDGLNKSGHGSSAPYDWLAGRKVEVTKYCAQDVLVTALLLEKILTQGYLRSPYGNAVVPFTKPGENGRLF